MLGMAKWFDSSVFYHIYPLGLLGAPKVNDGGETRHAFRELEEWIGHIRKLGCNAIYIGPLFESTTHGYDTKNYRLVDRRLGDQEDFRHFTASCHEAGIKVVVDGVFNHTGREFFAFEDLRANRESSAYRDWYQWVDFGGNSPFNDGFNYSAWRNCYKLANLNLRNSAVIDYLMDTVRFWITEFDIDGIRLDSADCLDFDFLRTLRRTCDEAKEDFWLMGEVIHGDYGRWIRECGLDSITNYELHKGLYSGHNEHNYFEIAHSIRREFDENGGIYKGTRLYTFLDNHDTTRIASILRNKAHLPLLYALLFTLPGIPSIYYGSEWGIEGVKGAYDDDALRPAIRLSEYEDSNLRLTDMIEGLGQIHAAEPLLTYGKYRELYLTNRQYAYARQDDKEAVITALNCDDQEAELVIPFSVSGRKIVDLLGNGNYTVSDDKINVFMKENSYFLFKIREE